MGRSGRRRSADASDRELGRFLVRKRIFLYRSPKMLVAKQVDGKEAETRETCVSVS